MSRCCWWRMETGLNETGFFRGQGNAECWTGVRPNSINPPTNNTIRNSGGWLLTSKFYSEAPIAPTERVSRKNGMLLKTIAGYPSPGDRPVLRCHARDFDATLFRRILGVRIRSPASPHTRAAIHVVTENEIYAGSAAEGRPNDGGGANCLQAHSRKSGGNACPTLIIC